ncbi:uncharacterized protein [Typha latifolia]|uniref:uncharacterized protein n=1 Tax=Typha latifolia TaxID=4733 RepID=UPI003C2BC3DE
MSKKKSLSGSTTMTLKDFHGGSIPSDLPLPSAPGVSVRPPDRAAAWGPAAGRPDHHRPRPGSAGAGVGRALDERPPAFLSQPAAIGRHFDEDERKPFDASSAPRRVAAPPPPVAAVFDARSEPKRPISSPVVTHQSQGSSFHAPVGSGGPVANAWAVRKEAGAEPVVAGHPPTAWSASRLAQASAVEKVTSGRWQSKPADVEVIRLHEVESLDARFGESFRVSEREKDRVLPGVNYSDGHQSAERVRSPVYVPEVKEKSAAGWYEGARPKSHEGRFSGPGTAVEVSERPKLKLLPRSKPLDPTETLISEDNQSYQQLENVVPVENVYDMHEYLTAPKPGSSGFDSGNPAAERPRLNLKPRSLPVEKSAEIAERERQTVFGGARPRELVLKERGVDVVAASDLDKALPSNRARSDLPKTDPKLEPAPTNRSGERTDSFPHGQRGGRDLQRKDYLPDLDNADNMRSSWRSDNRRIPKDTEKPLEQPRPEPETWRKPAEQPKPDVSAPRFGKAASALELAQAFSKSVSDNKSQNRFTNQRSLPGRNQVPFSRLTDNREFYSGTAQRQINGY